MNALLKTGCPPKERPFKMFISYTHKDQEPCNDFVEHLAVLERECLITVWRDHYILGGEEWEHRIEKELRSFHVIVLLVSKNFISSDFCYKFELKIAMERREREKVLVIPVLISSVDWKQMSFAELQALPRDKPVEMWQSRDEAFTEVVQGIRHAIEGWDPLKT